MSSINRQYSISVCAECNNSIFTPSNISGYVDGTSNVYYGVDANGCRTFLFNCSDPSDPANTLQISFEYPGYPLIVVVVGTGSVVFPLTCDMGGSWYDGAVEWPIDQYPLMCSGTLIDQP